MLVALALSGAACGPGTPARPTRPPNVVVVVVDTLRADRLGTGGSRAGLTPFLDELATSAAVFPHAWAASSWTVPSVASLFTSRWPTQHGVTTNASRLPAAELTLAEALRARGYATAGFTANFRLAHRAGFAQGFDHWQVVWDHLRKEKTYKARAPEVLSAVDAWLEARPPEARDAPLFLYVHLFDPHPPYLPPEPERSRLAAGGSVVRDRELNETLLGHPVRSAELLDDTGIARLARLYDAEVAYTDRMLRELVGGLERRGVLDPGVLVVTADHGESFREHERMLHGFTLYDPEARVPLLVRTPERGARRVDAAVSLVDLAPTVLAWAGAPGEPRFEGRSLVPALRGEALDPLPALLELPPNPVAPEAPVHRAGLVAWPLKILRRTDGEVVAFDLAADPGERRPRTPQADPRIAPLAADLDARLARAAESATAPETMALDEATRARLRALGYTAD